MLLLISLLQQWILNMRSDFAFEFIIINKRKQLHLVSWCTRSPRSSWLLLLLRKLMPHVSIERAAHKRDPTSNSIHVRYWVTEYQPRHHYSHRNLAQVEEHEPHAICKQTNNKELRHCHFVTLRFPATLNVTAVVEWMT